MQNNEAKIQRKSFVFYESFYKATFSLQENEQLLLLKAIIERSLYGKEPEFSGYMKGMYDLIVPQLEANERKYLNGCKGGEYGKLGGRPKKSTATPFEPEENSTNSPNVNKNVKVNTKDNKNVDVNAAVSTQQLSLFDIKAYIDENKLNVNAITFFQHYQEKGWKTDKGEPITDWKKLLRHWSATEKSTDTKVYKNGYSTVKYLYED